MIAPKLLLPVVATLFLTFAHFAKVDGTQSSRLPAGTDTPTLERPPGLSLPPQEQRDSESTFSESSGSTAALHGRDRGIAFRPIAPLLRSGPQLNAISWYRPWHRLWYETGEGFQERDVIPQFQHPSPGGILWGPFRIGQSQFELKPYPLRIPVFEHLYDSYLPFSEENFEDYELGVRTHSRGPIFYPEPQRLFEIQTFLWDKLRESNLRPQKVHPGLPLLELQWLWPPTEIGPGPSDLSMSSYNLRRRYHRLVDKRFLKHLRPESLLFHLRVPAAEGHYRHILMTETQSGRHVLLPFQYRSLQSSFWFFYQALEYGGNHKLAFLGAMFLPRDALNALLSSRAIRPAFT